MAERMGRLAGRLLSRRAVVGYVRELLTQYAALQRDAEGRASSVRLAPDARRLDELQAAWSLQS